MFNLIIEKCPEVVNVSGHLLDIETDFKGILKILQKLETSDDVKYTGQLALRIFYKELIPNDIELAVDIFKAFIQEDPNKIYFDTDDEIVEEDDQDEDREEVFSILYDSNYIHAAFIQIYNIDLIHTNMHWWKFKSLIKGLPSKTKLSEIIEIRAQELPKDPESKATVSKLKELYKLPGKDKHDEKQALNAIDALFDWAKS